jgi:D-alanyl-D-alanine carboxypeptidase/D-alanyl-D-alanine-endopeptidase (penicillin-binding protein 4)
MTNIFQRACARQYLSLSVFFLTLFPAQAQEFIPERMQAALQEAGVPATSLAVLVLPMAGNAAKLSLQPNMAMSPASTMKLVSSFIALDELGPTFRWKTQLLSEVEPKNNRLKGTLYLRGGGAPDLTWERLGTMLRSLHNQGVQHIRGNIALDRSYFQPGRFDLGLPPFDETPDAYYNVIPDALLVHSNLSGFAIESSFEKMKLSTSPPMAQVRIHNRLKLVDSACAEWEKNWQAPAVKTDRRHHTSITLMGEFPRNCKITSELNILDRNLYIEHLIRKLWKEMGGSWSGHVVDGLAQPSAKVLVENSSDTLADNVKTINKRSDNAMTRLLYLTLGAEDKNRAEGVTSFQAAEARSRQWFKKNNIDDTGIVLDNGSGLSRSERISAQQMASLLQVASKSNWFAEFSASLPIVGLDGTMRKRLIGSTAASRARIKTGTLRDTTAVAGYVRDLSDQTWVVVAMINHPNAMKARPALDALIEWVASGSPANVQAKAN